jgi:ssDNA-binding Zn-finger/Zn-ribbon topoisomerase 1
MSGYERSWGEPGPGFEVDLPCERCGAPNIGQEAGEWDRGLIFRTCDTCGYTQWWTRNRSLSLVNRRRRPPKAEAPPEPRAVCVKCEYSLVGVPLRSEDRGTGKAVLVQQCPECGRAEVVVPRPPGAPPRPRRVRH